MLDQAHSSSSGGEIGNRWLHRFALLTSGATFILIFVGGLVTGKGAGLAVPDWPTTFGYNMFLYPWSKMVGDIFYEHSHRLIGSVVGLLTILLTFSLWIKESRRWLRWLGVVALGSVIIQGILGGLRVVLLQHTLAIVHASFAYLFFALTVSLALFTSHEWKRDQGKHETVDAGRLWRLSILTTAFIYLQLIFGAILRHTGTRLDAHLLFALFVTIHVILLVARILRHHSEQRKLVYPASLLGGLLALQLILGIWAYVVKFTALGVALDPSIVVGLTTAHVATGALMLATSLVLTLRTYRLLSPIVTSGEFASKEMPV